MIVSLVAAMAENRVIGRDGRLPWHLPADMRFFRRLTTGHTVIMGRKTFESMDGPLPNRRNVVLSRQTGYHPSGATVVSDLAQGLELATGEPEVFVVGGAEIYRLALPLTDRIYLTVVHTTVEGDTVFPQFDSMEWELVADHRHPADEQNLFDYSFRRYERRSAR